MCMVILNICLICSCDKLIILMNYIMYGWEITVLRTEFEYILSADSNLGQNLGQWVAIVDEEIVAASDSAKEVYEQAKKKFPDRDPFIMKIPKETVMLL